MRTWKLSRRSRSSSESRRIAAIHSERLAALRQHPAVGDTRQLGTIAAVEISAGDAGYTSSLKPPLYRFFLEKGILLRPLGNVVYIVPPYVTPHDELHRIWDAIAGALEFAGRGAT